jgi:hypothetical protein
MSLEPKVWMTETLNTVAFSPHLLGTRGRLSPLRVLVYRLPLLLAAISIAEVTWGLWPERREKGKVENFSHCL